MTFTTLPSPSRIPCNLPVDFFHMKKFPSSEPDVIYSSQGPRKFTGTHQRSGMNCRSGAELTVFHGCYVAVPDEAGARQDYWNVSVDVKVRGLSCALAFCIFIDDFGRIISE